MSIHACDLIIIQLFLLLICRWYTSALKFFPGSESNVSVQHQLSSVLSSDMNNNDGAVTPSLARDASRRPAAVTETRREQCGSVSYRTRLVVGSTSDSDWNPRLWLIFLTTVTAISWAYCNTLNGFISVQNTGDLRYYFCCYYDNVISAAVVFIIVNNMYIRRQLGLLAIYSILVTVYLRFIVNKTHCAMYFGVNKVVYVSLLRDVSN